MIHACWHMEPSARPKMREVMEMLRWLPEGEHKGHPLWEGVMMHDREQRQQPDGGSPSSRRPIQAVVEEGGEEVES